MSKLINDLAPFIGFGFEFILVGIIYALFKITEKINHWKNFRKVSNNNSPIFQKPLSEHIELFNCYPIFSEQQIFNRISNLPVK